MLAGLGWRRRRIPAESARRAWRIGLTPGEERNCFRTQDGRTTAEHDMRERRNILCGREYPGVAGNSAQHAGVLILHFALNDAISECAIICRRRDGNTP